MAAVKSVLDSLCLSCRTKNLVPSLAALPQSCDSYGSSYYDYSYYISFESLTKSADCCPWCKEISSMINMYLDHDDHAGIRYRVDITFCCASVSHIKHFDRFKYHAYCFRDKDVLRAAVTNEGRLHLPHPSPDTSAAEQNLLSQNMVLTATAWLQECRNTHHSCRPVITGLLPTRLIDVRSQRKAGYVCLRATDANEVGSYAALSYCWGGAYNYLTTTQNLASHLQEIAEGQLPLTVKQAVNFTRLLNIDYLWVDALCILQDSKDDKRREIRNMRNIFKNAYVTLVASHASSVTDGFLFPKFRPLSTLFGTCPELEDGSGVDMVIELINADFQRTNQPVSSRAWTLEERLLSSRLLIFNSHGLFWQCEEKETSMEAGILREDGQVLSQGHRIDNRTGTLLNASENVFFTDVVGRWLALVTDYTARSLTHVGDKMPAIAGVAEEFSQKWGSRLGQYHAGLWSNYLVDSLAWQSVNGNCTGPPAAYRAPSWSWAAVDCKVATWPGSRGNKADHERRAKVSDIQVNTQHENDPYGSIESGHIVIQALTMHGTLIGAEAIKTSSRNGFFKDRCTGTRIRGGISPDFRGSFVNDNVEYRAILIECYLNEQRLPRLGHFMLLVPAGVGTYRRVGVFRSANSLSYEHLFEVSATKII